MMRLLRRNLQTVYYCTLDRREEILDNGYRTGEYKNIYSDPVPLECVIAANRGYKHRDFYGQLESYDVTLVTADMTSQIDEETMLYIRKEPEYDGEGQPTGFTHTVREVAPMQNTILYKVMSIK